MILDDFGVFQHGSPKCRFRLFNAIVVSLILNGFPAKCEHNRHGFEKPSHLRDGSCKTWSTCCIHVRVIGESSANKQRTSKVYPKPCCISWDP